MQAGAFPACFLALSQGCGRTCRCLAADLQVQKSWMYLEPIFSAQDIQKQLPSEYRAFDHVHKQLRDIMRRTKDRPNPLQTASNPSELLSRL